MSTQRTRILVVSDDEARAETVAKCIARGDSSAEVVRSSTADAISAVDQSHPHVVLLAGDGDMVRTLRGHSPELPLVVLVLSESKDSAQRTHVLDEGATDVVAMSELDPRLLTWRLKLAINHHESERRLRDAKEVAETASAHKTEFLSSMSHEIRTPLNTIVGMAELLEETQLDDRQRKYVSTLRRASDHVLALIENVLDLARIEAGTVTIEETGFDLYEVVESAIDLVRVQARRKKLDIGWTAAAAVPHELRGDPRRVRQVLVNLLSNAVKFTGQGRVWLTVERDPRVEADGGVDAAALHFTVTDTGVGIQESKLHRIFDGSAHAGVDTDKQRGFGLGLGITKRVIDRMGGRAWAESTLGKGSAFHVAFSLPIERGAVAPSFDSAEQKSTAGMKLRAPGDRVVRVLVVDDSEDNRTLLGEYLRGADVEVEFAEDGPTALERCASQSFDVVLMDLQLPMIDGYATTREILRRARETNMRAPAVIALSAHVLAESFAKSMEAGCTTQLTKPIRKRALLEAVAQAAGARAAPPREAPPAKGPMRDEILPLLPRFFANRRTDVHILREAVDKNDLAAVATLAHNMRGTGASYGFPEISTLGDALQLAGKRGVVADISRLATELEQLLDRLEARYAAVAAAAATAQQDKVQTASHKRTQSDAIERTGSAKH
jgi:signal transduction histidine kinase/FixJ family two-component response regulator